MVATVYAPFDNNPESTSFKTTSYTIPAGKFARVRLISVDAVQTATRTTGGTTVMTCNTATINGTNIRNGNAMAMISVARTSSGSTNGIMTLPAGDWNLKISISMMKSSSANYALTSYDSISIAEMDAGFTGGDFMYTSSDLLVKGLKNISAQVNIPGSGNTRNSTVITLSDARREQDEFWLKSGDIISGTGTFSWLVEEYTSIT
jgi:hypothetical protein